MDTPHNESEAFNTPETFNQPEAYVAERFEEIQEQMGEAQTFEVHGKEMPVGSVEDHIRAQSQQNVAAAQRVLNEVRQTQ
jgi:hypothetical protein